jgi:phage/plasmid-associated DNA primase
MGDTEILGGIFTEHRLDEWWHDFLGQAPNFDNFDLQKAIDTIPRTEVKAAEAVHAKFKNILTYTEARKQWYLWDGRIHTPCDGDGIALKIGKQFYKALADALDFVKAVIEKEALKIEAAGGQDAATNAKKMRDSYDKGEISKHKRFRDKMSTDAGLTALMRTLKTECDVPGDYFDNDQRWFVMRDYVLDLDALRDGGNWQLYDHDPARPVTKFFDATYDPKANLGHWDSFLEKSIPCAASREHLQIVTGAAFMGESKLRTILNLHGPPGSGKSVYVGTFFKLGKGGAGYSCMPDSKSVTKVSGQNFEQDSYKGRRFIGISEPPMGDPIDNEFLKKFTGDEWVETRTLNVKSSGWIPQGVVFVASNKALKINSRDKAIVERVQMIEFPIEFKPAGPGVSPEETMVAGLEDLIMEDRQRVLAWVIAGMFKFIKGGRKINPPAEVKKHQQDLVIEASTALRWVRDFQKDNLMEETPGADPSYCIPIKDAYQRYQIWIAMTGEKRPMTLRVFVQDITSMYGEPVVHDGMERFSNLTVTPEYRRMYGNNGVQSLVAGY